MQRWAERVYRAAESLGKLFRPWCQQLKDRRIALVQFSETYGQLKSSAGVGCSMVQFRGDLDPRVNNLACAVAAVAGRGGASHHWRLLLTFAQV